MNEQALGRVRASASGIPLTGRKINVAITRGQGCYGVQKISSARPRREHQSLPLAEAEAARLASLNPGETFVVTQEISRASGWSDR